MISHHRQHVQSVNRLDKKTKTKKLHRIADQTDRSIHQSPMKPNPANRLARAFLSLRLSSPLFSSLEEIYSNGNYVTMVGRKRKGREREGKGKGMNEFFP